MIDAGDHDAVLVGVGEAIYLVLLMKFLCKLKSVVDFFSDDFLWVLS